MSIVVNQLVDDISQALAIDSSYFKLALRQCEAHGVLTAQELRQLTEMGIPIVSIASRILRIKPNDFFDQTRGGKISYSDVVCILGIFAQDCMVEYQHKKISKYNG